jgi:hypothetical protein
MLTCLNIPFCHTALSILWCYITESPAVVSTGHQTFPFQTDFRLGEAVYLVIKVLYGADRSHGVMLRITALTRAYFLFCFYPYSYARR